MKIKNQQSPARGDTKTRLFNMKRILYILAIALSILACTDEIDNRVGRETKVFLPLFVSFPLTPPYVPFGIRRFNLFSKSV